MKTSCSLFLVVVVLVKRIPIFMAVRCEADEDPASFRGMPFGCALHRRAASFVSVAEQVQF
jgi:hypothetical protein